MQKRFLTLLLILSAVFVIGCAKKTSTQEHDPKAKPTIVKNSMTFTELGKTGMKVSELGLGCACFEKLDSTQSYDFMTVALDSGINYLEIWNANPAVRDRIGYALKDRRDRINIQGPIGGYWTGSDNDRTRDVAQCKAAFEDLLKRLGTDHIEVGMIHIVDSKDEWNEIKESPYMDYVKQLKKDGKIKHVGLSCHNAEVAYEAVQSGIVEVLMFSINPAFDLLPADLSAWDSKSYDNTFTNIDPIRTKLYNYCEEHGIGIVAMKAFGGGRLLDAQQSPLGTALTPSQCIAYALSRPGVDIALCGANTVDELEQDLYYLHATDAEKDYAKALSACEKACWKGECIYCGHCAPCPQDIDIDRVNKLLSIAKMYGENEIPQSVKDEYNRLKHHASECTQCGACESRCPFAVPVRENMKEAARIFGK